MAPAVRLALLALVACVALNPALNAVAALAPVPLGTVTTFVTTAPHAATASLLIRETIDSLALVPGLRDNAVYICFDGTRADDSVSHRCRGHNDAQGWLEYENYVAQVKKYAAATLPNVHFFQLERRGCLEPLLRGCMMEASSTNATKLVHVMQHDVPIVRPFSLRAVAEAMLLDAPTDSGAARVNMVSYSVTPNAYVPWHEYAACFNQLNSWSYFTVRPEQLAPSSLVLTASNGMNVSLRKGMAVIHKSLQTCEPRPACIYDQAFPNGILDESNRVCTKKHGASRLPPPVTLVDGTVLKPIGRYSDLNHFARQEMYSTVVFPAIDRSSSAENGFMEEADVTFGSCAGPLYCAPAYEWPVYSVWEMGEQGDYFAAHRDGRSLGVGDPATPSGATPSGSNSGATPSPSAATPSGATPSGSNSGATPSGSAATPSGPTPSGSNSGATPSGSPTTPPGPSSGGKPLNMKPKLDAAAKAKAKKAGKDLAASYTKEKADKKAADAKMTKEAIATAKAAKAKKKNVWKAKKKKKFKGKVTLTGIDLTKTDTATKNAKAAFEEATAAELNLTEEDEITFTYTKVARRRRLLAVGTTVSYEITVAEDTAVALEAKLTEDPEITAIMAMSAALSTDFPEAVTAEVVSETLEVVSISALDGAAAVTVTWAAGAASVAVCLALW